VAESDDRGGGFVTGLLLGALGGVVIATLATPRSGGETRDMLLGKARAATGRARDVVGDVNETIAGGGLLERGRSIVDAARARLDGAISEGRDAAERQRSALEEGA
jgi:gas vesicle protein